MKKVLIIDDDVMNLKTAERVLTSNYQVLCASSGIEGLQLLEMEEIDIVLLDLELPQMSGMEVLRKIRENLKYENVKVSMLTASGAKEDVIEAMQLGALDFIKKPFLPAELLERVKKMLAVKKERILVVDDERMSLMFAKKMLGIRYDVSCVSSGNEALEYLKVEIPDLILLDYHMPQMNGLEVMEKLQESEEYSDIPVIFLTADNDPKTEIELFKAGAMDYICKPFSAEVVIRRISRILELYHFQDSLQQEVDEKTKELRESNRKVINLSMQLMMTLASVIDAKDAYTKGHSFRVAEYARELARRMGMSSDEVNRIYYIGLVHDIGKIGISDQIINKQERLTKEEYETTKAHPEIGAKILQNISEMPELSFGAHWHHERYDGNGYPDGLAGTEIPVVARIICVADAYDVMASKRAYRDVMSQEVVRKEFEKGKGMQFDPVIADHMIAMIDEDTNYDMREK